MSEKKVWKVWSVSLEEVSEGELKATLSVSTHLGKDKHSGEDIYDSLRVNFYREDADSLSKIKLGDRGAPVENTYITFNSLSITPSTGTDLVILKAEKRRRGYRSGVIKAPDADAPF